MFPSVFQGGLESIEYIGGLGKRKVSVRGSLESSPIHDRPRARARERELEGWGGIFSERMTLATLPVTSSSSL